MRAFITVIFILVCIALTIIVLSQEGKDAGLGSMGGAGESYWGRNKSRSMEGNLIRITRGLAIGYIILALILNLGF